MDLETMRSLAKIAAADGAINLLNVYKGVPLSFPARIVELGSSSLQVEADNYQVVCLSLEKKTFIQNNTLPDILRADVMALDKQTRVATLANLMPVQGGIGQRMQVRIQPRKPLESDVLNEQGKRFILRGDLADLSQDGLAIYFPKEVYSPLQFAKGATVTVTFRLPGEYVINTPGGPSPQRLPNPIIKIHAVIANVQFEEAHTRYRIGMWILLSSPQAPFISQFLSQRQAEIIREIKAQSERMARDL